MYTSMHSAGLELTKLTYTRLEDNLIRHRGDRMSIIFRWHHFSTPRGIQHDKGNSENKRQRLERGHRNMTVLVGRHSADRGAEIIRR